MQDEMVNSQDAADRDVESNVFVSYAWYWVGFLDFN